MKKEGGECWISSFAAVGVMGCGLQVYSCNG